MSFSSVPLIPILEYSFVILSFTSCIDVLHLCWMLPYLSRLLTCHNDVIDTGQNNRLFAPGTIWIGHFLVYHTSKKGTCYVQICDQLYYMKHWLHIILVFNNMNKVEISMHMTVFSKGFDMSFWSRINN